jgi:penicillin-binding protein 1A
MIIKKVLLIIAFLTAVVIGGSYIYFTSGLPDLSSYEDYSPNLVTKVYSHDEQLIGEFYVERRVVVPMERMPEHLVRAFLAAEDARFYEHEGISYTGIFRAFYKNLQAGRVVQGGSTITQQLAKSFLGTPERKLSRKIREAITATRIERQLDKDEILGMYLNQIYFGSSAYGIQTASETYFGKNVDELNIAESALLAGLPKAPSRYSPYSNFEKSKVRQEFILKRMLEEDFITLEDYERAIATELVLQPRYSRSLWIGRYFTENVRKHVEAKYGRDALYKGGLKIYTTLDVELQRAANVAVRDGLRAHDKRRGYRGPIKKLKSREAIDEFNGRTERELAGRPLDVGKIYRAVITEVDARRLSLTVDIGTRRGVIRKKHIAWAKLYNPTTNPDGGKYEKFSHIFNVGDVVKVKVRGIPASPDSPVPLELEQEPQAEGSLLAIEPATGYIKAMVGGYDFSKSEFNRATQATRQPGSAFKPIIYAAAIDHGYTPATIVVDSPLVFEEEEKYARRMGITSLLAGDLSLALGSSAVTLEEMTTAFATLANNGARPDPLFITKIVDKDGYLVEEHHPNVTETISPQTAYIMTNLLESVIESGTGWRARALKRPAAGKTGTTNNLNDAWFLGYVPELATGVWVGYDEEKQLGRYETGSRAALPIWTNFMLSATSGTPVRDFSMPEGIEFAKVDPKTGLLATPSTKNPVFEVFKAGTVPLETTGTESVQPSADFFMLDTGLDKRPAVDGSLPRSSTPHRRARTGNLAYLMI